MPLKEERYSKRQNDFSRFYVEFFLNFDFILDNVIIDEGDIIKSTKLKQIEPPEENDAVQKEAEDSNEERRKRTLMEAVQ